MKRFFARYPVLVLFLGNGIFFCATSCKSTDTTHVASHDTIVVNGKDLVPEGIAINPSTGIVYLSSLNQDKIVSVDADGNCRDLISARQDGFMKGIGIKISKDRKSLWACTASLDTTRSTSGLFQIDLASGKVLQKFLFDHDSSSLFNDLAIHSSGLIYITDTFLATIFRYNPRSNTIEPWLTGDQLTFANGLVFSPDEKVLFVASGDKGIQRIDMSSKAITAVTKGTRTDYAVDGLVYHDQSIIGVIGWPQDEVLTHRVIRYRLSNDYYMQSVDTLVINKPYINSPTTSAVYKKNLYVLGRTNLGLYNRGGQSLETVRDLLSLPLIVKIHL